MSLQDLALATVIPRALRREGPSPHGLSLGYYGSADALSSLRPECTLGCARPVPDLTLAQLDGGGPSRPVRAGEGTHDLHGPRTKAAVRALADRELPLRPDGDTGVEYVEVHLIPIPVIAAATSSQQRPGDAPEPDIGAAAREGPHERRVELDVGQGAPLGADQTFVTPRAIRHWPTSRQCGHRRRRTRKNQERDQHRDARPSASSNHTSIGSHWHSHSRILHSDIMRVLLEAKQAPDETSPAIVVVAVKRIDGATIAPGESFSF